MTPEGERLDRHLSDSIAELKLPSPFLGTENTKPMSITGFQPGAIRAAIDAAKKKSQAELEAAMGKLADAQTKAASVPDAIHKVAAQMTKEADDALQELSSFTNGGPE